METILRSQGHSVFLASNGNEGLEIAMQEKPDLIFSDIMMPEIDGFRFCRLVKEAEELKNIPVVLHTVTFDDPEDQKLADKVGASRFILKTTKPADFIRIVNEILEEYNISGLPAVENPLKSKEDLDQMHYQSLIKKLNMITQDLREKNRDLQEREKFINNILESVEEGFIVIDKDYRIISANRSFCKVINSTLEEIVGKRCYEVSHHINRPCYEKGTECPVEKTFASGEPHSVVHTHYDKDGNTIIAEVKSYAMKDESGEFISVIETINDITAEKKLEAQLRHVQKMETVGQLAGGLAHDFNNILTAMIGFGSILNMKMQESDPLRINVKQILSLSEKAAQLIQSLLAYSRKQVINLKQVNPNVIIKKDDKIFRRLIREDIELKMHLSDKALSVMADSGQIDQVLMNLVVNARDAMPDGGLLSIATGLIKVDNEFIKFHGYGKRGLHTSISVSDTGAGMDKQTMEKIFEPFFTTKEIGKGTGLGLATVYGIIKQHNGYIDVFSELGKGTTFKILLPAVSSEDGQERPSDLTDVTGGTETLLLAEDNEAVRGSVKSMLEEFGYKVIYAVDGEDAIDKFMKYKDEIALLVLDVIMPKKNGDLVCSEIRKMRPDIKVLFMSGYPGDVLHKKGILDNDVNLLLKPVSPATLIHKVRDVLDAS